MLLKNLVIIKGGKRLPKGKLLVNYSTKHPYIKVKDMTRGIIELTSQFEYVADDVFKFISKYTVETGQVILSIVGTIGNVSIIGNSLHGASLTENCVKLICNENELLSKYLFYFLISHKGNIQIKNGIVGTTQPKLPIYNIEKIDLPLPLIQIQQHIINTIGTIDDLIEKYTQIINSIRALRRVVFKVYSQKSLKDEEFLEHITLENGAQPPKSEHIYEEKPDYIRFIQNRDYDSDSHLTYIPVSNKNHLCSTDDIMIDKYGDAGAVRYGLAGAFNVALLKIIPNNCNEKEYIRDFLSQEKIKNILFASSQASTRPSLNETTFKGIMLPILSNDFLLEYQSKISGLLNLEFDIKRKMKEAIRIKNILLSKYF